MKPVARSGAAQASSAAELTAFFFSSFRTTSKPRGRKPTTTIDAFPARHPAQPLPGSSPLTFFLCHRWGGWRTDLKEKIIIKKSNMVISK